MVYKCDIKILNVVAVSSLPEERLRQTNTIYDIYLLIYIIFINKITAKDPRFIPSLYMYLIYIQIVESGDR